MNKMLVAVFNTETAAYQGLDALRGLHVKGDITLYATAVINKNTSGEVKVKQEEDSGPANTALGVLTGALVGLLGGPAGLAVGAASGGFVGMLLDIDDAGVNVEFLNDVSDLLAPGKSAILAEIDEDWVTPVNTQLGQLGGEILRRPRLEVIEDQLVYEAEAFQAEVAELKAEIKESNEETKTAAQNTLKSVQERVKAIAEKAEAKLAKVNNEAEAKINGLKGQMKSASEEKKAKIQARIDGIKADQELRGKKLRQASQLAREALKP
jgi:uncharacterized membrane protein